MWTDETWTTGGRHRRAMVTRKKGEEWESTCVLEKVAKKKGWMFWGSFSAGLRKGPCLVWEKEWGTINKKSYCQHIVPLIDAWVKDHPGLELMQDGAPGHSAQYTKDKLNALGITLIWWPAYSPDLNPIESVWNWMKDWLAEHYPEKMNKDQLRRALLAAWKAVPDAYLDSLIDSMPRRCQAVINANGRFTKY